MILLFAVANNMRISVDYVSVRCVSLFSYDLRLASDKNSLEMFKNLLLLIDAKKKTDYIFLII